MFTFDHELYLFVCFFPFLLMLKYGIVYISIYLMDKLFTKLRVEFDTCMRFS